MGPPEYDDGAPFVDSKGRGKVKRSDEAMQKVMEARRAHLESCEKQMKESKCVIEADQAFVADDLQPIETRCFAAGGDKYAGSAASKAHHRRHFVFHIDSVIPPEIDFCSESRRQSEQPLQNIEIVNALIDQQTTAFATPGTSPVADPVVDIRSVPGSHCPAETVQVADD